MPCHVVNCRSKADSSQSGSLYAATLNHAARTGAAKPISIFVDYSWLPDVDFDGWVNETVEALASCPNIPTSRLEAISLGLRMRVGQFERHVDDRARLHPELRPVMGRAENESLARSRSDPGRGAGRGGNPLSSGRGER